MIRLGEKSTSNFFVWRGGGGAQLHDNDMIPPPKKKNLYANHYTPPYKNKITRKLNK